MFAKFDYWQIWKVCLIFVNIARILGHVQPIWSDHLKNTNQGSFNQWAPAYFDRGWKIKDFTHMSAFVYDSITQAGIIETEVISILIYHNANWRR